MRVAYASVEGRNVNWSYDESLERSVGGRRYRSNFLIDTRLQLESEIALKILHEESNSTVEPHKKPLRRLGEGDYILLDGTSFFGGRRGFHISLYTRLFVKRLTFLQCVNSLPCYAMRRGEILRRQQVHLHPIPSGLSSD